MYSRYGLQFEVRPREPENWSGQMHKARRWARKVLEDLIEKRDLTPQRERQVAERLRGMRAEVGFADGRLTLEFVQQSDVMIDVALGIAMLLETGLAARLRQCEHCSVFFLPEKGKHGATYCRACQGEAKAAKNAERQRRYRERQKAGRRKPAR